MPNTESRRERGFVRRFKEQQRDEGLSTSALFRNANRRKWSTPMRNRVSKSDQLYVLFATFTLALIFGLPSTLHAQTFQKVPALAFTKVFAGAEPLPQVLTIAFTNNSTVRFTATASTTNGGSWLSISPGGSGCCFT